MLWKNYDYVIESQLDSTVTVRPMLKVSKHCIAAIDPFVRVIVDLYESVFLKQKLDFAVDLGILPYRVQGTV